jgi:hypothetical protein
MTHLLPSAAYIRKDAPVDGRALRAAGLRGSSIDEKVWELLETPQTIDSLQRAASRDTQADRGHIAHVMERLLDADLIEVSPDS